MKKKKAISRKPLASPSPQSGEGRGEAKNRQGPMTIMKNELQNFMQQYGISEIDFGSRKLKAKKK